MWFIGDVHGKFLRYMHVLDEMPLSGGRVGMDCSLQVGDMGIGFPARMPDITRPQLAEAMDLRDDQPLWKPPKPLKLMAPIVSAFHRFIRGNHDDPAVCREHPNYLGDWGYCEKPDMFYVAGGLSVDQDIREPGVTWWPDEELPARTLLEVVQQYGDCKPRIVVTHECPTAIKEYAVSNIAKFNKPSRTELALQAMFNAHQPEFWIFGHHHVRVEARLHGTHFVGLDEMMEGELEDCIYELPGLTW